jgi:hypothetical protein
MGNRASPWKVEEMNCFVTTLVMRWFSHEMKWWEAMEGSAKYRWPAQNAPIGIKETTISKAVEGK